MSSKRMIEDYIPVQAISVECVREKLGGHRLSRGMPRNLHLWWARRPLAACRAAVYATFAPAAEGPERDALGKFFTGLCRWTGPVLAEGPELRAARDVVEHAAGGLRPRVLDMFAGGGAIPLEALRLGADVVALELNPVAHLIELCTLAFPQQYGAKLRDAVKRWGGWVIEQTRRDLGELYPDIPVADGPERHEQLTLSGRGGGGRVLRPIAYLWTRTIPSPARGYERGMVPLVRQTWLRKKVGNFVALRQLADRDQLRVRYELVQSRARNAEDAITEWGFNPAGHSVRGATTCPFSGSPVTIRDAKAAGRAGQMRSQLMAVVCMQPGARGKRYVDADRTAPVDEEQIGRRLGELCQTTGMSVPDEQLPGISTEAGGIILPPAYGLDTFGKLFTLRQQLLLLTLCKYAREAHRQLASELRDSALAAAIAAYLGLLVGRVADRASTLCHWDNSAEKTAHTYARQALPMVWDFSEPNPFGGSSGDLDSHLDYIVEVIEHAAAAAPGRPAEVIRGRAQTLPLADASIDAVVTDPPYYDNISYADLSDFFYVWQKRALGPVLPAIFATSVTPKRAEIVAAPHRHDGDKDRAAHFYELEMLQAFSEAHRVLRPDGPMVVVYAHRTTLGWATLVDSLRRSGFSVAEAWPLDTEMPDRAGQMKTAALASSIFLAARKREVTGTGDYATSIRPEMAHIVQKRVHDLMRAGISGADLVIAAVGAGLQPFTRFERVELPNGEELSSVRFLEELQREVLECILAAVFAVDRSGVGQVDKASRFYVLARYQYGGAAVEFGEVNVLAQGVGVELAGPGSLSDGKRALLRIEKGKAIVRDYTRRGADARLGLPVDGAPAPLIDVLQRLVWLVEHEPAGVGRFLDEAQTDVGRLHLLVNALKGRALADTGADGRTEEQKAVDRLLAQWRRVVESRLPLFGAKGQGAMS